MPYVAARACEPPGTDPKGAVTELLAPPATTPLPPEVALDVPPEIVEESAVAWFPFPPETVA